jgi:hypothetical protein
MIFIEFEMSSCSHDSFEEIFIENDF